MVEVLVKEKGDCTMDRQQEELRTRTIEINLSDADVKSVSELAGSHGLTIGKLIENFIHDLVGGAHSNGSDERMFARQWFERCWFGMFPDYTFLRHLIEWDELDTAMCTYENTKTIEESIQKTKEALVSGVMIGNSGKTYTWQDITDGEGTPCYSSREQWEQEEQAVIAEWQEEAEAGRQTLADYWKEYVEQDKKYKNGTFDEEMEKVLDYWKEYQRLINE